MDYAVSAGRIIIKRMMTRRRQ